MDGDASDVARGDACRCRHIHLGRSQEITKGGARLPQYVALSRSRITCEEYILLVSWNRGIRSLSESSETHSAVRRTFLPGSRP